jgi:hypothetical protein
LIASGQGKLVFLSIWHYYRFHSSDAEAIKTGVCSHPDASFRIYPQTPYRVRSQPITGRYRFARASVDHAARDPLPMLELRYPIADYGP